MSSCSKPVSILPQDNKENQKSKLNKIKNYNLNKPKKRTVNNK